MINQIMGQLIGAAFLAGIALVIAALIWTLNRACRGFKEPWKSITVVLGTIIGIIGIAFTLLWIACGGSGGGGGF